MAGGARADGTRFLSRRKLWGGVGRFPGKRQSNSPRDKPGGSFSQCPGLAPGMITLGHGGQPRAGPRQSHLAREQCGGGGCRASRAGPRADCVWGCGAVANELRLPPGERAGGRGMATSARHVELAETSPDPADRASSAGRSRGILIALSLPPLPAERRQERRGEECDYDGGGLLFSAAGSLERARPRRVCQAFLPDEDQRKAGDKFGGFLDFAPIDRGRTGEGGGGAPQSRGVRPPREKKGKGVCAPVVRARGEKPYYFWFGWLAL